MSNEEADMDMLYEGVRSSRGLGAGVRAGLKEERDPWLRELSI